MGFDIDMTNRPVVKTSIKLAVPVIIGQILALIYGIVDLVFVSMPDRQSAAIISGIGPVFLIYMLYLALRLGVFTGVRSLVARCIGVLSKFVLDKVSSSATNDTLITVLVSSTLFCLFGQNNIEMLAGSKIIEAAKLAATDYLYFIIPGLCFLLFNQLMPGIFQGEGIFKHYAASVMLSTVLNIVITPLFVFTFNMGVAGSATATSISIFMAFIYLLNLLEKKENKVEFTFRADEVKKRIIKEISRIGLGHVACILIINMVSYFPIYFLVIQVN